MIVSAGGHVGIDTAMMVVLHADDGASVGRWRFGCWSVNRCSISLDGEKHLTCGLSEDLASVSSADSMSRLCVSCCLVVGGWCRGWWLVGRHVAGAAIVAMLSVWLAGGRVECDAVVVAGLAGWLAWCGGGRVWGGGGWLTVVMARWTVEACDSCWFVVKTWLRDWRLVVSAMMVALMSAGFDGRYADVDAAMVAMSSVGLAS